MTHDIMIEANGYIAVTCTCGAILAEHEVDQIELDELVDIAWRHRDD